MDKNVAVVVLTLNPGEVWLEWIDAYKVQDATTDCYVIDSSSDDSTPEITSKSGLNLYSIERSSFDHGGTRNFALKLCADYEYIIYLTQDAILADTYSINNILKLFEDLDVAAVCGRQLPRQGAGVIESHARLFNYPEQSRLSSIDNVQDLGIKAAFLSNSFAAYRVSALQQAGGFPDGVIFGEDMYIAARLLKAGYRVVYDADARVYHSHDYSLIQEFKRYFDMGVFHTRESWIRRDFGAAESEGRRFVVSELKYLMRHAPWRIPESILRTILKYIGYRLGCAESCIPLKLKKKISMNPGYFKID